MSGKEKKEKKKKWNARVDAIELQRAGAIAQSRTLSLSSRDLGISVHTRWPTAGHDRIATSFDSLQDSYLLP